MSNQSTEHDREAIEALIVDMEAQAKEADRLSSIDNAWDHGYCVAAGAYASRLREVLGRQS